MIMLLSLLFGRAIAEELAKDQKCEGLKSMAQPAPDHFLRSKLVLQTWSPAAL